MSTPSVQFDVSKHPTNDTIKLLASLLEKVIKANDRLHPPTTTANPPIPHSSRQGRARSLSQSSPYTCFHARSIPNISIHAYLTRILKYCPCANECFLALLVYFDRMSKSSSTRPSLRIDSFNIHRLIIAGVVIASKLFSDIFFTNTRYAKVGGLPASELNILELEFLRLNDYALFVGQEELQQYGDQLQMHWIREHETNISTSEQEGSDDFPPGNVGRAARHLSIDHGVEHDKKDMDRKDEIDNNRVFKRPSFTHNKQGHLPTPPGSASPGALVSPSPSSSQESTQEIAIPR
ncbi:hypothetical protein DFQ28_003326 [Apophysomyces sp. BC1034]|nr:hypothetical protein DFQ30_004914 [Apophysomyces sp. BC1015]KAG0177030.1 hypothetical protein DFQ29_005337 [Apophysomyces sp. BC1021]KAG0189512.1 hypothetical protein DFQ28_003326 [Apophysomyces sp. BC1034]